MSHAAQLFPQIHASIKSPFLNLTAKRIINHSTEVGEPFSLQDCLTPLSGLPRQNIALGSHLFC
jgi:hypothetical protein